MVIQIMKEEHHATILETTFFPRTPSSRSTLSLSMPVLCSAASLTWVLRSATRSIVCGTQYSSSMMEIVSFSQRADLDQLPKAIAVIATGEGCALLQVKFILFDVGNDCYGEKQKKTKAKQDQV